MLAGLGAVLIFIGVLVLVLLNTTLGAILIGAGVLAMIFGWSKRNDMPASVTGEPNRSTGAFGSGRDERL